MTGYDAATVEACAARLDALLRTGNDLGAIYRNATITQSQEAIRALPIAPPASLQVDKISPEELSAMFGDSMPFPVFDYLFSDEAPKRSTAEVRFALRKLGVLIPLAAAVNFAVVS